jgi:hypothetical protein
MTAWASPVANSDDGKVHLPIKTNSEIRTFRACPRRHRYAYILRRRPRKTSEALAFGTLWHHGQEAWWTCEGDSVERYEAAVEAMRAKVEDVDSFALVMAEELTLGYSARWDARDYVTVTVERAFEVPLINPTTGAHSRTYCLGGKVDAVAVERSTGRLVVIEHKTTASDLELGSIYWRKVSALDTQVSTYLAGARAIGLPVVVCIYDVVRKPGIRALKATPHDERRYTKPKTKACPECKKKGGSPPPHTVGSCGECSDGQITIDPGGKLYENMREHDETPEEYRMRLREDIAARPERYFARGEVVRLEADERDHAYDTWQVTRMMREAELAAYAPKNPDACTQFGPCPYLPVCEGQASIDDDALYRTAETPHEELQETS